MIGNIRSSLLAFSVAGIAGIHASSAQNSPMENGKPPPITQVAEGVFKVGDVTVNKNSKTVSFPAIMNLENGYLEYVLVGIGGKTHESLFATKVEPYHLHVAMLLLGAKMPDKKADGVPPEAIDAQYLKTAPKPQGDWTIIRARWKDGKEVEVRVEDLIFNEAEKAPMTRGAWVYNGSVLSRGVFLAQQERSFIALVIDPAALVNNTRPGCDNDQIWTVRTEKAPKAGTPVEILIQLQSETSEPNATP